MPDLKESIILMCPVCCSVIDAAASDGEKIAVECVACGTHAEVTVILDTIAEHGING